MAGSALMLVLGFLIAVAVIVFLSNAAPTKPTGGGMPAVDVAASGSPQASVAAGMDMGGAVGAGGSTGAAGSAAGTGAGALAAQTYAPASSSNKDTLRSGETLAEGASLTSKNGKYVFTYEYGAAVVKSGNFTMWTSPGNLTPGGVVKITADGNIGIFSSQYSVTPSGWSSATAGQGTQPYSLVMKDDGRLLLYDSSPMVIWSAPVTMPPVGVDCLMGSWGEWSACSKNCGGGVQTRNRSIITPSNTGGKACGETVETRPCNTDPCPDCAFTWTPFGQCVTQNPATGAGKKQSTLIVSSPSGPGGSVCPDPNSNIADCVNCVFSPWDPAGELSAQACNQTTGIRSQTRTITVPASGGGTCTEPLNRQEACAVDCQLNPWPETWSACENKVNGVGKNTRTTTVKFQPKNGGKACTTASGVLSGTQTCDANGNCTETRSCGDCVLGTTYTYGNCDPATGRASRTRVGDVAASNGGNACPGVTDDVACDVNCQVSGWGDFSACDISSGQHSRTRTVTQAAKNNGTVCPALTETAACDVDCKVGEWSEYGACSKTCGGGKKTRTRTVTQDKKNSGAECPALSEETDCNTQSCSADVVGWAHQFGTIGNTSGAPQLWYQKNGSTNGVTLRLRDVTNNTIPSLQLTINGAPYAWPDVYAQFGSAYTGTVALELRIPPILWGMGATWREVGRNNVSNATGVTFGGVQVGAAATPPPPPPPPPPPVQTYSSIYGGYNRGYGASGGSDIRLKTNLRKTGRKIASLDEYMWDWNEIASEIGVSSDPTTGVIAQEALVLYPDVVFTGPHGYYMVNYARLRAIKE